MDFLIEVLSIYDEADAHSDVFWRVENGNVRMLALCNDLFAWAMADCEQITPENLPILRQAQSDLAAIDKEYLLSELFAARVRGMRPQRPWFIEFATEPEVVALFEACGPERDPKDEG